MSSGDLSVPNRSWDKPSPLGLSAPASGYSMHPLSCIYRTLGPPATSPTWGPSGPRYPFAPLTPRGETSLFWKEMEWGQQEQPGTSAAHTPAQLLRPSEDISGHPCATVPGSRGLRVACLTDSSPRLTPLTSSPGSPASPSSPLRPG